MKDINSIVFATISLFNDSIRCVASAISIEWPCKNWVAKRIRSRVDLVITKEERKSKEIINSQNEVAFADVFWSHTRPMSQIISSRQNMKQKCIQIHSVLLLFQHIEWDRNQKTTFLESLVHVPKLNLLTSIIRAQ